MSIVEKIGIEVDVSQVESATKALTAFSEAAERAAKAIAALNGHSHAGVTFQMVGDIARLEVVSKKTD